VRAADIVSDVSSLPDVDAASATVTLPAHVSVRLEERVPLFVWSGGGMEWLVDDEGMLFGPTVLEAATDGGAGAPADDEAGASADEAAGASAGAGATGPPLTAVVDEEVREGLPMVLDARIPEQPPTVGSHLAADDLAVMRQLLSLTPELLGSRAGELQVRVDQDLGYWIQSDLGWLAIFGHYYPRVQPPERIASQVQCLQALLARREPQLERVWLAVNEDACGTFTERGS
jgi:hypothetical protein